MKVFIDLFVLVLRICPSFSFFFFNDTATTEIYTLSLHDALPIYHSRDHDRPIHRGRVARSALGCSREPTRGGRDRKSTRPNSSHSQISYAVFCLKKKKKISTVDAQTTDAHARANYGHD